MGCQKDFQNDFYIISEDFRILDFNKNVKKRFCDVKEGDFCYKSRMNRDTPCLHCPIAGNSRQDAPVFFDPVYGDWIQAIFSSLGDGRYAVTCRPIQGHDRNTFDRIKESAIVSDSVPTEDLDADHFGMFGGYCEKGHPLYYINSHMLELLGYESREEFEKTISGELINCIHPEDIVQFKKDFSQKFSEGMKFEASHRLLKKDGSSLWVLIRSEVIKDMHGRLVMMHVCLDISAYHEEQERREKDLKALIAKDKLWADITKLLYSYSLTVDFDTGKYTVIPGNRITRKVSFLQEHEDYEVIYEAFCKYTDDALKDKAVELLSMENLRKRKNEQGFIGSGEFLQHLPGGDNIWHEVNVFTGVDENGKTNLHVLARDVTESHDNERLRQTLKVNKIFLNSMPPDFVACAIVNLTTGTQVRLLRKGSEIQEIKVPLLWDDFLRDVINAHMTEPDKIAYMQENCVLEPLRKKRPGDEIRIDYYTTYQSRDGSVQPVTTILTFFEQDGLPFMTIFTSGNATIEYEKKLKVALDKAEEANRAKSAFLFNMSHDIRTPMNAIIGFTMLAKEYMDDKERLNSYLDKITTSNEFLLSIINNVLEMARIESGKETLDEEPCDMMALGREIVTMFAADMKTKGVAFVSTVNVKHRYIYADEVKVRKIMLNLLSNAGKYTPAGGTVSMTITELPSEKTGYIIYRNVIEDTGVGMSKEFLEHLFEPFVREKNSTDSKVIGTGLGMPIVKKMVELMGGTIEVESEPGKGTRFTFTAEHRLVEDSVVKQLEQKPEEVSKDMFRGKRILLAEDNELNAEIAMTLLENAGFVVEHVENGLDCVEHLVKADFGYYDLILMDVQMPKLDGYQATRKIRNLPDEKKAGVPIIAMTANAFEEDRQRALQVGMDGFVSKPIEVNKLMDAMRMVLG